MKKRVTSYTFDASAKTVDSASFSDTDPEAILLITNITDGIIIYNFADPAKGGTVSGTTLTLDYDTTSMSDTDRLQIFIEDSQYPTYDGSGNLNTVQTNSPDVTIIDQDGDTITDPVNDAMRTVLVTELPAGTQNIGDVDIVSLPNEGQQTMANSISVAIASNQSAIPITDNSGSITVDASSLPLPTGASTAAKQPALGTAGTASADVITVQGIASMTALKVDGSAVTQPVSISGNQAVNNAQVAGTTTSTGNGTTDAGTQRVTLSSDSTGLVLAKLKDASGNNTSVQTMGDTMAAAPTTTLGVAAFNAVYNGTNFVRQPGTTSGAYGIIRDAAGNARGANVNASNQLSVSVDNTVTVGSHAVTNAGTFAVQATAVGTVADDATTPGAPVMIGGKAVETDGTDPTSVSAEDDVAIARTDRNRRLLVNTYHPNLWTANDNQSGAQTNTSLKSAPGANLSLYITDVIVSNGATAGDIRIVEDPAGTPVIKVPKIYMAINGGAVLNFSTPIRITANKAVGYTSTTVTTHSVQINGYTAP